MTYPNPNPEATQHEQGLITLLKAITYIDPTRGGGDVHGARKAKDAIDFSLYIPPALVVVCTGGMLAADQSGQSATIGGCVFDEDLHFEIYTVNSSFDTDGSGRLGDSLADDPGSYRLITDVRLAAYNKTFDVLSPWPNSGPGPRKVKVMPVNPTFQRWDIATKEDANRIVYRMNVRTTWLINAG